MMDPSDDSADGGDRKRRLNPWLWTPLAVTLLVWGCAERAPVLPKPRTTTANKEITRLGYSIQVGAFSTADKALMLAQYLEREGLNAYYFHHKTGLYKVRFGNFPSKDAAAGKAESLFAAGVIHDYYLVSPEDYAVAKVRVYGTMGLRNEIVETAESFIGLPYQWGGASVEQGFDCSGFTMAVYQLNGLNLPRSSKDQYLLGTPVEQSELEKGDLVFFTISSGEKVSHVGLYTGDDRFIHAPGKNKTLRQDSLLDAYYDARYAGARTYLR